MTDVRIISPQKKTNQWLGILSRRLVYALGLLVLILCYIQYRELGWALDKWDWMLISGLLAFILALLLAQTIPVRMTQTLKRLIHRGVLGLSETELDDFQKKVEVRAQSFSKISAAVVALAILVAFLAVFRDDISSKILLTILEIFLGAIAGYYIGQMSAYGTLGQLAGPERISIVTKYGHIDGAAGLKPIGDFYFFQAVVMAIPCLYLAIWWFITPSFDWYSDWSDAYLALLAIGLLFEILSFFLPMWTFHLLMQEQKIKYLADADELSKKMVELEEKIIRTADPREIDNLQKQLDFQQQKYGEIEHMPTWPVDAQTRQRFTINNLLLFLPFFSDIVHSYRPWLKFWEALRQFLAGS